MGVGWDRFLHWLLCSNDFFAWFGPETEGEAISFAIAAK